MVAHIVNLLGAPVWTTSVRVRGCPAQLGLAVDEYAQLRRYAPEIVGPEVPIPVHHCTQLAHNTLDRLEGVSEDWQGARLSAPDSRVPDHFRERTTRSPRPGRYQPVGPRARMTRPEGSGRA